MILLFLSLTISFNAVLYLQGFSWTTSYVILKCKGVTYKDKLNTFHDENWPKMHLSSQERIQNLKRRKIRLSNDTFEWPLHFP